MIYPATHDITILQNSNWKAQFRVTQDKKRVEDVAIASSVPTFTVPCHGFNVNDKLVFIDSTVCEINEATTYYVIASSFTGTTFKVSTTLGGSSIEIADFPSSSLYVSRVIDLTGYTVDADIKNTTTFTEIATFTTDLIAASEGLAELSLSAATTLALTPGVYGYDMSLTSPGGERYYWLTGSATVVRTYSRN